MKPINGNLFQILIIVLLFCYNNSDTGVNDRIDCYIESVTEFHEKECLEKECVWSPVDSSLDGTPWCFFNTTKVGYQTLNSVTKTSSGIEAKLKVKSTATKATKFAQIETVKFEVHYLTENIVRFKITDANNSRYEVPVQKNFPLLQNSTVETDESKRKYSVDFSYEATKDNFHFSVIRKDSQTKIWDTSIGGLIFSDQFLQIATYLPSKNIYGFGENTHKSFKHQLFYKAWPLFAGDIAPGDHERNLYGVHPFYTCLESDGKSHGVLFLNSNAMEYKLFPYPALSLKTTGGVLDFFVFVGDNPEHVIQMYTSLIGRPFMPPFWALGFQLTRYGYHNTEHVKRVIDRTVKHNVPMDVHYIDIDYMKQYEDFTYDTSNFAKLPELIAETKKNLSLRWTFIIDPAIQANDTAYQSFTDGYKQDVFVRWPKTVELAERNNPTSAPTDRDVMYGRVWPNGPAAFPDFFKNATKVWWKNRFSHLYNQLNITFDAIWIDMNEPSNFDNDGTVCPSRPCYYLKCPTSKYDELQVRIKAIGRLSASTLCMIGLQGEQDEYLHYDVHSLYGFSETEPTQLAIHEVTGKRGFVVSRSTFVSSGRYGAHWLGDNNSQWPHMKHSIIGMLEFNLFGIPFVGADICGFGGNASPELCKRWSQLGAFYPFSRNHNEHDSQEQDPAVWAENGHPEVTEAARNALNIRYSLLPYLYTLFYRAHTLGETVARPLFHEYPHDNHTYDIDQQFLWGRSILISPFLVENQNEVDAYIPDDVWYERTPDFAKLHSQTGFVKLADPVIGPPIHFRGGSILPVADNSSVNTKALLEKPLSLHVFPDKNKLASGDLFMDDGDSIETISSNKYNYYEFQLLSNCTLEIRVIKHGFAASSAQIIGKILVANTNSDKVSAHIDGNAVSSEPLIKDSYVTLSVNINLNSKKAGEKWVIDWKSATNQCNIK